MATFLTNLWESIFTPGATPTLLLATNYTFGALQLLLLVLLVTTQSIHFVALSFLCGGLWYAINWFAAEVQAVKAKQDADERDAAAAAAKKDKDRRRRTSPDPPGSDTETETEPRGITTATAAGGKAEKRKPPPKPVAAETSEPSSRDQADTSAALLHPDAPGSTGNAMGDSGLLNRRRSLGDSSGYVSTDSEWEKVGAEDEKK